MPACSPYTQPVHKGWELGVPDSHRGRGEDGHPRYASAGKGDALRPVHDGAVPGSTDMSNARMTGLRARRTASGGHVHRFMTESQMDALTPTCDDPSSLSSDGHSGMALS